MSPHAVELAGAVVPCDVNLVAIGVAPAVELMEADRHGIPTDSCGRTAIPGVYACGDVAAQWRPSLGRRARVEHWTSAVGQGAAVAHAIAGADRPHDDVPYFWSDQFGLRLQHVGHAGHRTRGGRWRAGLLRRPLPRSRTTSASPALLVNRPREVAGLRRELAGSA